VFGGAGGAVLALGGCRNVFGGQGLNATGFEFLAVSSMPPAQSRCQLNGQRQSRDAGGPGRALLFAFSGRARAALTTLTPQVAVAKLRFAIRRFALR
jgi:hypothetical protein